MKKAKALLINTVLMTATSLIISTAVMSFNVYISNKIGAEAMGLFSLISSIYGFALTLAVSGIGLATTRLVAEELALHREGGVKTVVKKCLTYALFFGVLSGLILFCFSDVIGEVLLKNANTVLPLKVMALSLPFIAMTVVLSNYFTAVRRPVKSASVQLIEQFFEICIVIYLLQLLLPKGMMYSCLAVVLGGLISQVLAFFMSMLLYLIDRRRYRHAVEQNEHITGRMLAISVPVAVSSYLRSALNMIKHTITPVFLQKSGVSSSRALAQYGMIRGMVMPLIFFPSCFLSAMGSLLVPEVARFHAANNSKGIEFTISQVFKITLLFSIGVGGIVFGFSGALGEALYKSSEVAFYIGVFSVLIPVMYFDEIVDGLLKGLNQQVKVVQINIIDTVLTTLLILFMLPRYGIKGYIITIFISEVFNAVLSIWRLIKVADCRVQLIKWIAVPLFAIAAALFFSNIFKVGLIVNIMVTAVFYIASLYALGIISIDDYRMITRRTDKKSED